MKFFLAALALFVVVGCASSTKGPRKEISYAGSGSPLRYTSSQLALKDLDDMNRLVQLRVRGARSGQADAVGLLREALRIIYARPNEDFMSDKLIGDVRGELTDRDEWENSIKDLAEESAARLQNPEGMSPAIQLTYILILENLLSDFKPNVNEAWVREWMTSVRDAQIELTREARNERAMKMMKEVKSPSDIAAGIIAPRKTN